MQWKEIPGYSGFYLVSDDGRVARLTADGPTELKLQRQSGKGYLRVTLRRGGRTTYLSVHRAMALAFLPNPDGAKQVRHLNDIPDDNRLENLAWGTPKQNTADRVRNGRDYFTKQAAEQTHCKRGLHERTPANLVTRTKSDGRTTQACKPCELGRSRLSASRHREENRERERRRILNETPEQREHRLSRMRDWHRNR